MCSYVGSGGSLTDFQYHPGQLLGCNERMCGGRCNRLQCFASSFCVTCPYLGNQRFVETCRACSIIFTLASNKRHTNHHLTCFPCYLLFSVTSKQRPDPSGLQSILQPVAMPMGLLGSMAEGRRTPGFNHVKVGRCNLLLSPGQALN
jgi:hypothetical protein